MAYDEEQARRSRVVVETPTERREVVHSQSVAQTTAVSPQAWSAYLLW